MTPSRVEALALGIAGASLTTAAGLPASAPIASVGVAGALDPSLRPGDLVVASELRSADGRTIRRFPAAPALEAELRRSGCGAVTGPLLSAPADAACFEAVVPSHVRDWALAMDGDAARIAERHAANPLAVIRAISPPGAVARARALGSLLMVRAPLERWAKACARRQVVLAAPRSFCAGVERAIEIVERAIERYGPPVYVRRQIVHNSHVVASLEHKGAIFVTEMEEVPPRSVVVIAAHGVSPEVRRRAAERGDLEVIDATCPLVAKVHSEARRYAARGHEIVLVGHAEHEEVVGTVGEAPDRIHVVGSAEEVEALEIESEVPVAYLTQTTLATDEAASVVTALRHRFPAIVAPPADDICYATQNRQEAVRAIARRCDLMLVVGSANSSNTTRLVEVAEREGCPARLVEDASQVAFSWLEGARRIGVTAGASAPPLLVDELLEMLGSLGGIDVEEEIVVKEAVRFALPAQVR